MEGKGKEGGIRPEHEGLLALAEKLDEKKREVEAAHQGHLAEANAFVKAGKNVAAAALYDVVARAFADAHLPLEAEFWRKRGDACLKAKQKPDGRTRRGRKRP